MIEINNQTLDKIAKLLWQVVFMVCFLMCVSFGIAVVKFKLGM